MAQLEDPRRDHPHLHSLLSDVAWDPDGKGFPLPSPHTRILTELFRDRVLQMPMRERRLSPEFTSLPDVETTPGCFSLRIMARRWAVTGSWAGRGRHELVLYPAASRMRLFDLESDPHETRDLSEEPNQQSAIRGLAKRLAEIQVDDPRVVGPATSFFAQK